MSKKPYHFDPSDDDPDCINPGEGSRTTMISLSAVQLLQEAYGIAEGRHLSRGDAVLMLLRDAPYWADGMDPGERCKLWMELGWRLGLSPKSVEV